MKEISVGDLQPDETVDAMHEARLLSKLDHPSIVQFHDSFIDGEYFCIVTEYCEVDVYNIYFVVRHAIYKTIS
jgi:NIMA (never in mitosis gene a)-related kinase